VTLTFDHSFENCHLFTGALGNVYTNVDIYILPRDARGESVVLLSLVVCPSVCNEDVFWYSAVPTAGQ